jgi:hypothetical protein
MCWALYLASDKDLPLVSWNEKAPGFNVQALSEHEFRVKRQFSFPNVVYVGSHEGCSCGFMAGGPHQPEREPSRAADAKGLFAYLKELQGFGARLEMLLCWEGDEEKVPIKRGSLSLEAFQALEFPLGNTELAPEFASVA